MCTRGPKKIIALMVRVYLRCKKIKGDWLESWCGPRNPRLPPRWPPILWKMSIYINKLLQHVSCLFLDSERFL